METITQHAPERLHDSEATELLFKIKRELDELRIPFNERMVIFRLTEDTELLLSENHDYALWVSDNCRSEIIDDGHAASVLVIVRPGANVTYRSMNGRTHSRVIVLNNDAHLDWQDASLGTGTCGNTVHLLGRGAHAKYRGLAIAAGDERYAVDLQMVHHAGHTSSNMLTRAALLGASKGTYRGTIKILPGAAHCDAYQRADTLLLGSNARMDAQPNLEIGNDDVKCSHGVTLGQVSEEQLFYLESRGIGRADATRLLIEGFFDQLLISMGDHGAQLRNAILQRLEEI